MRAYLYPITLAALLGLLYSLTLAPGITWASQGADSGGLVSAAYTGGAAHPPGYPLYLGLARLAQQVLPGEIAMRTNLLSAFFAILAALMLYKLLRRFIVPAPLAALASLSLGLAPAFWAQAIITEVYTLQLFLSAIIFLQMFSEMKPTVSDLFRGLVFGLALSNHATTLFLAPVLLFNATPKESLAQPEPHHVLRIFSRIGVAIATALVLYATLLLRGASAAPVNWGKVTSLSRLWWLVSGGPYRDYLTASSDLGEKLPMLLSELAGFGLPLLLLASLALIFLPGLQTLKRLTLVTISLYLVFGLSYNTRDWFVTLLPVYLLISLWLGLGLARLPDLLRCPQFLCPLRIGLAVLVGLHLAWNVAHAWPQVDASRDNRAVDFANMILTEVPPGSLIFTTEDRDTFALWYYHYVLGQRPDVAILPTGLLEYDWQRENLRLAYPQLVIPEQTESNFRQAIITANPDRPVCAVFIDPQTAFMCR